MSDDGNEGIPPSKKFKKLEAASTNISTLNGNGESSLLNRSGSETNFINQRAGSLISNINSNVPLQISNSNVQNLNVNQGANYQNPPIVRTLLHNENCLPSPWFTGRREYLLKLEKAVRETKKRKSEFHYVVISGLWGMGKTQVAREFIAQYKKDYGGNVFWINASSGRQMINSFLCLAEHFNIDTSKLFKLGRGQFEGQGQGHGHGQEQEQAEDVKKLVKMIYDHFDNYLGEGLFIFDGAKQFVSAPNEAGVKSFLPNREKLSRLTPNVIITSRSQDWSKVGQVLPLGPLYSYESTDFIKKALEIPYSNQHNYDSPSIYDLANRLNGFPLVLAHVCAKIANIMKTAHGSNWNDSRYPYNLGPNNYLNTKLEDEIKKYIKKWEEQSPFALLSAQELRDALSHIIDHDSYHNYIPELWEAELTDLTQRAESDPEHKMALEFLEFMSYLPHDYISVKLLYFILHESKLPLNSQSVQNLRSDAFDDRKHDLGLLTRRSLINYDKSKREMSGQVTHYEFYQEDDPRLFLGHLNLKDFFLENYCGKIIIHPLIQKLMRFRLKNKRNFKPLLHIVNFYLKNSRWCHQLFCNWGFFTNLKELEWPGHSYIAALYHILYIGNALYENVFYSTSNIEKLQEIYLRLKKPGRKTGQDSMYLKLCWISIIFLGGQNEILTCIKNEDFSASLNISKLFPREKESSSITIRRFITLIVNLMMDFQNNFLVWFCGGQIFLQMDSRENTNDSDDTSATSDSENSLEDDDVNKEGLGDKKDQVITGTVEFVMFGGQVGEKMAKLINLYFKTPPKKRKQRIITEKDVELAEVMTKATGYLFELPPYKKVLMNVRLFYLYLNGDEEECECDEVKYRIWTFFIQNLNAIPIWSSWLPENTGFETGISKYNIENSSKIKGYFMDINGVEILEKVLSWFLRMLRKYKRTQIDLIHLMVSVFEIVQEHCFESSLREEFLESSSFISSFSQLFSGLMQNSFADKANLIEFKAIFPCAVSCLALSLPLIARKKTPGKASSSAVVNRNKQLESEQKILRHLENTFFWNHSSWTRDILNFSEKAKSFLFGVTERSRGILEKVMQTRREAEHFKEDDLETAQLLISFCLES